MVESQLTEKTCPKRLLYLNAVDGSSFKAPWMKLQEGINQRLRETDFYEEFQDMESIASQFLKDGQTAVELFGWGLPAIPSFVKSKIGKKGKLYCLDADSDCLYSLFINFVQMLESYKKIKTGLDGDSYYHNSGTPLHYADKKFLLDLESILSSIDLAGAQKLDPLHKTQRSKLMKIAKVFYQQMNITPIKQVLPPYPAEIKASSVNAVIEHNGFAFILEEQKEGIVIGADRLLKPGGYLIFKDIPREQAVIQYYGNDIFKKNYEQVIPKQLSNPYNWLVLKKKD